MLKPPLIALFAAISSSRLHLCYRHETNGHKFTWCVVAWIFCALVVRYFCPPTLSVCVSGYRTPAACSRVHIQLPGVMPFKGTGKTLRRDIGVFEGNRSCSRAPRCIFWAGHQKKAPHTSAMYVSPNVVILVYYRIWNNPVFLCFICG